MNYLDDETSRRLEAIDVNTAVDPVAEIREAAALRSNRRPVSPRKPSIQKWTSLVLIIAALAAFLSSESTRKEMLESNQKLNTDLEVVQTQRGEFHDFWQNETVKTAKLTSTLDDSLQANSELSQQVTDLGEKLSSAEQRSLTLLSEKEGLNRVLDELRGSLTQAITDHRETEASLSGVIASLETKTTELEASLADENQMAGELKAKIEDLTERLKIAEGAADTLRAENADLQKRVTSLGEILRAAESERQELKDRVDELTATNSLLLETISSQKHQLTQTEDQLLTHQTQLNDQWLASLTEQSPVEVEEPIVAKNPIEEEEATTSAEPITEEEIEDSVGEVSISNLKEEMGLLRGEVNEVRQVLRRISEHEAFGPAQESTGELTVR